MENKAPPGKTSSEWYRDPWEWILRVLLYGVCATGVLTAFLRDADAWNAFWNSISGQTAAAWVQAVGSILAIVGATVLAQRQIAAARETAQEQIEAAREAARQQVQAAEMQITEAKEARSETEFLKAMKHYVAIRITASRIAAYCKVQEAAFRTIDPAKAGDVMAIADFFEYSEFKSQIQRFDMVDLPRPHLISVIANLAGFLDRASRAVATANSGTEIATSRREHLWNILRMTTHDAAEAAIELFTVCNEGLKDMGAEHMVEELHDKLRGEMELTQEQVHAAFKRAGIVG